MGLGGGGAGRWITGGFGLFDPGFRKGLFWLNKKAGEKFANNKKRIRLLKFLFIKRAL